MSKKPVILVVEDDKNWHTLWKSKLKGLVTYIEVNSRESATKQFKKWSRKLDLIVMDACVPGGRPNTLGLVERFKKTFKGPILACSSKQSFRRMQVVAGCTATSQKRLVPSRIKNLLKL